MSPRYVEAVAACCFLFASCSNGKPPLVPLGGKVLVGGVPAENALVIFHPAKNGAVVEGADVLRPTGRAEADGSFRVTTFDAHDGALAGEYVLTVEWRAAPTNPFDGGGPDKLQGKYSDPKSSTLKVSVDPSQTQLAPLDLPAVAEGGA